MAYANLGSMHREVSDRMGAAPAVRHKSDGRYVDLSWRDSRRRADRIAAGLLAQGVEVGDRIALLSENRLEWILADAAMLSAGCITVPLHAPLTAQQVEYQLLHAEVRGVFLSGPAQAAKLRKVVDSLPHLQFVVSFEPIASDFPVPVFSFEGLAQRGAEAGEEALREIRSRERSVERGDLATILYTSGTTGPPKGVMLTHENLLSNVESRWECGDAKTDDVLLSWLPYSHIYARTVDLYLTMVGGSVICLAESPETLVQNLAETQPTWMTAVPRFYEKIWTAVQSLPPDERKRRLGYIFGRRLRRLCSGGAPLPRHIAEGFHQAGVLLLEGYGLTETSPVISFIRSSSYRLGTVGQCLPGVEVRIADDGEILTRGPHVMKGYWMDADATDKAIVNGWFHTGDLGEVDSDGFLSITGRKKDLIVTSGGKNVAPAEIERLLIQEPLIDQAIICGDDRPYLTALIVPDFAALESLASKSGWSWQDDDGVLKSEPIEQVFAERIEAALECVSPAERVRQFVLLSRPFLLEEQELTATMKLRRQFIIEKHRPRLDALYATPAAPADSSRQPISR